MQDIGIVVIVYLIPFLCIVAILLMVLHQKNQANQNLSNLYQEKTDLQSILFEVWDYIEHIESEDPIIKGIRERTLEIISENE